MVIARSAPLAAVLLLAMPGPGRGQQAEFAISPHVGIYIPTADVFKNLPLDERILANVSHRASILFGARATVSFSRFGIEAEAGYAPTNLDLPGGDLTDLIDDASIFLSTLNLVVAVFEAPFSPLSLYVMGGGGIISRGGNLYDTADMEGTTNAVGVVGLALRVGVGPAAHLRFDVRDYLYSFKPSIPDVVDFDAHFQNDLVATIGLAVTFGSPR